MPSADENDLIADGGAVESREHSSIPSEALSKGDIVRIQLSWSLHTEAVIAKVTAIGDDGPLVHGPAMRRPQLSRAGLVLEVLDADKIVGQDNKGETHVYCQKRGTIHRYQDGDLVGQHRVPEESLKAYLREVENERGWDAGPLHVQQLKKQSSTQRWSA